MEVVQSVFGTFHHFDLARELNAAGYLKRIYSTYPWMRLKREDVPRDKVRPLGWIQAPWMVANRHIRMHPWISRKGSLAISIIFDASVARQIEDCDVFVGLSSTGLKTGRLVQSRGGKYVCDRGCSHIRFQSTILDEECARWGAKGGQVDPGIMAREEAEYAQADAITVPSQFARRTFLEFGFSPAKVISIPLGVRLDRFSPTAQPPKDSFDLLFAGGVSLRKGIPYLLEAFAKLNHPTKKLRIAGAVSSDIRSLLRRFNLAGVEFLGPVSQAELARLMSASHVLVLPSIEDGFGLVMAQAMACGTPVIASENTGGPDLFSHGKEGFIVPIRSPETICERLTQLADDPTLRQRMSEAALARVKELGGWTDYGRQYAAFLLQLTKNNRMVGR